MSNAEPELKVPASTTQEVKDLESERSSLDSYHDNPSSRQHSIIKKLYINDKKQYTNEDEFVKNITTKKIPDEYYLNRDERLENRLRGFFTTRMECLVNKKPLHFKDSPNTSLTFVYDQGPHPVNYFEKAVNGMFISDAVDTASKLSKRSQRPVLFTTPKIELPGSYIGFNENVVRTVIFSDFKGFTDQVGCRVIIEARLNDNSEYRWFDLSQKFDSTNNNLIGYRKFGDARPNANFKKSNDKNTGFFIGNANAKKLLENEKLKPILALCLVVAKILGDFSSALASSPGITSKYTGATQLYGQKDQISNPDMIIHASGDRLCSLESSRQGGNSIKTSPRNSDGIIPIQYTPGTSANLKIDYKQRFNTIYTEIIQRFNDLKTDVSAFSIYKYKVDGEVVPPQNKEKLEIYARYLEGQIVRSMGVVEEYIKTIPGDDKTKYETLYRQKIALMPQAPLISTSTKDGYRKNLNTKFHIYRLPNLPGLVLNLRDQVYKIIRSNTGGKRKLHSKRLRRTLRLSRGGQKPTRERALTDFNDLIYSIRDKMFNFALSTNTIDYDSNPQDILIEKLTYISKLQYGISINEFIELVKQNIREVTDEDETKWANTQVEDSVLGKRPPNTYIADYDEEFMEEVEEAIKQHEEETIDPEIIALMESITFDESTSPTNDIVSEDEISTSSLTDTYMTEDETPSKKNDFPSTPSSRASTPNSEPQTLPIDRSRTGSDTESSQNAGSKRKRKTYRRIRLF
jgi:hypothetical protein